MPVEGDPLGDEPEPGMLDELFGVMPVELFVLFGPVAADGEPAEFCMPPPPMPAPFWVEPAWDGLALAAEVPVEEVDGPPALGLILVEPVPIVWANPAVALRASTAPAIIIVFMEASTLHLKYPRARSRRWNFVSG